MKDKILLSQKLIREKICESLIPLFSALFFAQSSLTQPAQEPRLRHRIPHCTDRYLSMGIPILGCRHPDTLLIILAQDFTMAPTGLSLWHLLPLPPASRPQRSPLNPPTTFTALLRLQHLHPQTLIPIPDFGVKQKKGITLMYELVPQGGQPFPQNNA